MVIALDSRLNSLGLSPTGDIVCCSLAYSYRASLDPGALMGTSKSVLGITLQWTISNPEKK